jgi:CPA2 family monovalent cation:H+ antiporter-2
VACGASYAVPETVEASLQLGEMVLTGVGVPDQVARQIIDVRRQKEWDTADRAEEERAE